MGMGMMHIVTIVKGKYKNIKKYYYNNNIKNEY